MSDALSRWPRRRAGVLLAAALMLLATAAVAQEKVYTYEATPAAAIPLVGTAATTTYTSSTGGNAAIIDDAYNGTQGSMTCKTIAVASETGANTIVGPVTVTVPIASDTVGNLVIKLFTPTDSFTLMSRPGYVEPADDGAGNNDGDTSNMATANPISFAMSSADSAENMGNTITGAQTVCAADGRCTYLPNNGASALSENLADSNGDSKVGNWTLCVGDSSTTGGNGTLAEWTLNLGAVSNPCTSGGLAQSFGVPDSFSVATIGVALNITHTNRGDLHAILRAPSGALLNPLFAANADTNDNYDITMGVNTDPSGAPVLNDGTADPVAEPYYARMVNIPGINFYTGAANGAWTLFLCDENNNAINGTLNRAKLVLTSAASATQVCTSTLTYNWADNGNDVYFPTPGGVTRGDVTLKLDSTRDLTGDEDNTTGGRRNFTTRTDTFGAVATYFLMTFDDVDPQNPEGVLLETNWSFTPAVRYLSWRHLDMDWQTGTQGGNNGWEDYVRVTGRDAGLAVVPYQVAPESGTPSFERTADVLQGDTGNVANTSINGNAAYVFDGAISTVQTQYMEGDDWSNPAEQRIGIGNATWCAYDFGDAPNTYGDQLSTGPKHVLGARSLWLGVNPPDGEADGQPAAAASTDDLTAVGGIDDEDGFEGLGFPACPRNGTYSVTIRVNNQSGANGFLDGYIDWNRDGDFADANERSATVTVATGTTNANRTVSWSGVPANCGGITATYARFRFTTSQTRAESPTDGVGVSAPDGEVEDYRIADNTLPVTIAHVTSAAQDGALTVRWTTASETANGGFDLFGRNAKQEWVLLASVPTQGPDSFSPQRYMATVAGDGIDAIKIEDVSLFGERRAHGPFKVGETAGEEPEAMALDWATIRAQDGLAPLHTPGMRAAATFNPSLRKPPSGQRQGLLQVRQEGIQRVTYEDLRAAGIDLVGIAPSQIALVDNGAGVPRHVFTTGSTFGPGSYLEFYARPQLTLASPFDAFVITVDQHKAVAPASLPAAGGSLGVTTAEDVYRPDHVYSFSAPNGDPWFDQGLLAYGHPASTTRTFDLPNLASGPVELDLKTWGYGGWPGSEPPDHHVVVLLNGTEIANGSFDDITAFEKTVDVTSLVQESANTLEVHVPGDTGYRFDYIAFEGFSVRYPRATVALGQRFGGTVDGDGVAIAGFGEGQAVAIWRHDGLLWQRGEQNAMGGQVFVAGGEIHAASAIGMVKPGIAAGVPQALAFSKAQYVIVTHPAFAGAMDDLVALEQSRGFSTEVVTTDRIFATYSDHTSSAEALHRFLTTSFAKGKLKYVLLVGADTTDPYDHLGAGSVSFVPTDYKSFVQYITFSPTDETLVDADGDGVGDVPIGRLPVRTATELQAVVAKLRAWEQNLSTATLDALLASGASDEPGTLTTLNQSYASSLDTWTGTLAPVDDLGAPAVRTAVLAAMNAGTPLVSFVGHSAMGQWDFTPILRWQDVAAFTNTGKPNLVAQWGCWNSYYVEPGSESLSARMLATPDAGVAAAIGATTLTSDSSHQMLGNLFYRQVNLGAATVGEAFHNAKVELSHQAIAQDAILGMALLGDPAMSLPHTK
jgi:subtilisin-like proprotein convertase family protein